MKDTKRNPYFDNAKFILIFLVVFGHLISPIKEGNKFLMHLYTFIFLFHMPAFIFISGFFSKNYLKKGNLLKYFKKTLLPYFIFQIIYSIFYFLINGHKKLTIHLFDPHWSLWFLISLFCWHLLLYIFGKTRWTGFFVSIIIGISVGYFDSINGYFSLSRTFVFFPYFFLGYLLDKRQLLHMIKSKYSIYIATSILIGAFLTLYFAVNGDINSWLQGDTPYSKTYDFHITGSIVRMFQYGLTILIIFSFLSFIPSIHFFFTFIGQRTLYVYLLHGFIVQSIYTFISIDILKPLSNHYLILLLLFTLCVCLFLGSHIIKKLTSPFIELKIERSSEQ